MKVKDDYARVGVPMLPGRRGQQGGRPADRALQLGHGRRLAAAVAARLHRLVLHRRWRSCRAASGCGRRTGCRPRQGRGDGREAQGDAAVPLVDHLCVAAVRRRRGGPLPALTSSLAASPALAVPVSTLPVAVITRGSIRGHGRHHAGAARRPRSGPGDSPSRSRPSPRRHGGSAEGQLAYIGRGTAGSSWSARTAAGATSSPPPTRSARRAVENAGITLHEDFDGELAAKVRTGPYEWTRMAGIQLGGPRNT